MQICLSIREAANRETAEIIKPGENEKIRSLQEPAQPVSPTLTQISRESVMV